MPKNLKIGRVSGRLQRFMLMIFIALVTQDISAQNKVVLINSKVIDFNRYNGIDGDPYFYNEFLYGKIISTNQGIIDSIEVRQEDEYVALAPAYYPLVVIYNKNEEIYFKRTYLKQTGSGYSRIVHTNDKATLLQNLITIKLNKTAGFNSIASSFKFKKKWIYHLELNEETSIIKLKKKSILPFLGHQKEILAYMKKENLSFSKEVDLIKILDYYASLN
jgi:hypothetical protein